MNAEFEAAGALISWLNEMKWGCPGQTHPPPLYIVPSPLERCLGSLALVLFPAACAVAARGATSSRGWCSGGSHQASQKGTSWLSVALVSHLSSVTYHPLPPPPKYPSHFPVRPQTREQASLAQPERRLKGWGVVGREGTSAAVGKCCCSAACPPEAGVRGRGQPWGFLS